MGEDPYVSKLPLGAIIWGWWFSGVEKHDDGAVEGEKLLPNSGSPDSTDDGVPNGCVLIVVHWLIGE